LSTKTQPGSGRRHLHKALLSLVDFIYYQAHVRNAIPAGATAGVNSHTTFVGARFAHPLVLFVAPTYIVPRSSEWFSSYREAASGFRRR
jgi:hypothetical protein